jgi:hypothetical protein
MYFAKKDDMTARLWDDRDAPSMGLFITMHLDWMATFRVPDVASSHMWSIVQSLVRTGDPAADAVASTTFNRIQKFVANHHLQMVTKIHACPCGRVIYHDFKDPQLRARFRQSASRREHCPLCGISRYVPGTKTPRKIVYYISPEYWLRDLFQRQDMAAVLLNDRDPAATPVGSIQRSEGYKEKVTENPMMNCDARHAPLVGMADGAPFFKDRNAGSGWFFILRHTGLPVELQLEPTLAHMTLFISNYHLNTDRHGVTKRVKR